MIRPAIVIIAYNREAAFRRLLHSIEEADYPDGDVTLIISVDRSTGHMGDLVREAAKDFDWKHGEKKLVFHEENLGLKKHVLSCGDFCKEYGAVIMLEDDLYVSPAYYSYAMQALEYTADNDRIGGISLYNHLLNVHAREPFQAIDAPCDNWYFQFASSWGQAFTKEQWNGFRSWLTVHDNTDLADTDLPYNVSGWSDRSWLKYYIKYLVDTDRFFLYPMVSYTTNFCDEGTHAKKAVNDLQVPLSAGRKTFTFESLEESRSVYDAFFENIRLREHVASILSALTNGQVKPEQVAIDLYGYRGADVRADYLLSSKLLPYRCLKMYGRYLRPHDENIFQEIPGESFFLYDLHTNAKKPQGDQVEKLLYNYRALKAGNLFKLALFRLRQKL